MSISHAHASKRIALISMILALSCSFCGASLAGNSRALVLPFSYADDKVKAAADNLTQAALYEVKAHPGFYSVNRSEFIDNWLSNADDGRVITDEMKEKFDLRALHDMLKPEDIGTLPEFKNKWKLDFIVACSVEESGDALKITIRLISMDTGRFYADTFDSDALDAKTGIRKHLSVLLDKAQELRKVMADGVADPIMSTVYYDVKTAEGEKLRITADYTSDRPAEKIQNITITPSVPLEEGEKRLTIISEQGKAIQALVTYSHGAIDHVYLDTAPFDAKGEREETLVVKSEGGYLIRFIAKFRDGKLENFFVRPDGTPYP